MAKISNIDLFVCDRCSSKEYYSQADKGRQDWQEIERYDVNKVKKSNLLCPTCFEIWKSHQTAADADFTKFMKG